MIQFQDSINRTFEETESLLEHLKLGNGQEPTNNVNAGAKMPKVEHKKPSKVCSVIYNFNEVGSQL